MNASPPMKMGSKNRPSNGGLTPSDKACLRKHLRPGARMLNPSDRRHAFIMVGNKALFLVHMTMFHMEEHCHQIILRAHLPKSDMEKFRRWRREDPHQTYFLANLAESAMDVPELASGKRTFFEAEVLKGIQPMPPGGYVSWPWDESFAVIAKVRVTIERVVYHRHFDFNFDYPRNLTYVLFGAGDEAHMQSYQTQEPDYDHVLSLKSSPRWLPATDLESAVTVNFPNLRSRPLRLRNPLKPRTYHVEYQGFRKYLGFTFAKFYPLTVGTTWWFSLSPLNIVLPGRRRRSK